MDREQPESALVAPHCLDASDVARWCGSDVDVGLTALEARERLARRGPNAIPRPGRESPWMRVVHQFTDLLTGLLVAAAAVAWIATGEVTTPVVVLAVVVMNAVLGLVQQERAASSLESLREMLAPRATVLRDGVLVAVDAHEVVPGDVIAIEMGDKVPADARIVDAWNLEVDESALTGESLPIPKSVAACPDPAAPVAERTSMLHKGTVVARGRARAVVTATGLDTAIGDIARSMSRIVAVRSPLQRQLDGLGRHLAGLAAAVVTTVSAVGFLRGQSPDDVALTAVALAVASIPEGLPAVTAVTLAVGARRLAARNAIVSSLGDVETLGATSVICTDKTGTVTANRMVATVVAAAGAMHDTDQGGDALPREVVECAVLCGDCDGRHAAGDPTERALVAMGVRAGADPTLLARAHPRIAELPFESENKFMATVHRWPAPGDADAVRILVKGAPDVIVRRTARITETHGAAVSAATEDLDDLVSAMAGRGLRTIALAHRDVPSATWRTVTGGDGAKLAALVADLTLDGLVGIADPPRPEVAAAVAEARRAGISVTLITGDHPRTAVAVADAIGLDGSGHVMSGADIDLLDDAGLDERVASTTVFARVDPGHKLRIVEALRRRGHVVAMTGDGVNDAPALRSADIGVAMGVAGTDVARDASRMVLADDNFATIVRAVRHGRTIHDNVVKFVHFQVATTVGFAMLFLLAGVTGVADGAPLAPLAILLVNVVMDGPPAIALGLDRGDDSVMDRPPRRPGAPIIGRDLWLRLLGTSATMAVGTLVATVLASDRAATTVAFNAFVAFQCTHLVIIHLRGRRLTREAVFGNRLLWWAIGAVVALQVLVTHHRGLGRAFGTVALGPAHWAACATAPLLLVAVETARRTVPRFRRRRPLAART